MVIISAVRAKFCEALAHEAGCAERAGDLFLVGLFSLLETIVGRPLDEVLGQLALPEDCKLALLGADSALGRMLSLAVAYECGEWERVRALAGVLGISEAALSGHYLAAVDSTASVGQIAA